MDNENFIHMKNKSTLKFKGMLNRIDLSDIKLCCDNQTFNVHRFLLAACSPYFRTLFRGNSALNAINLKGIDGKDLQRVIQYMYEGSVKVKDKDLEEFGRLLEMFRLPLPEGMTVVDLDDDECVFEDNVSEIDLFISKMRDLLKEVTLQTVDEQSRQILNLAQNSTHRLGAIVNIMLQLVVELSPKCTSVLFGSLAKCICKHDKTEKFQEHIRKKSAQVLRYLENTKPMKREPLQLNAFDGNSLDKELVRIETIEFKWDIIRRQRLQHFIAHMFQNELFDEDDFCGAQEPDHISDIGLVLEKSWDCCEIGVPSAAQEILQNMDYQNACQIENHLFWLQIESNQHDVEKFSGIIKQQGNNRRRKRRGARSQAKMIAKKAQVNANAANKDPKPSTSTSKE